MSFFGTILKVILRHYTTCIEVQRYPWVETLTAWLQSTMFLRNPKWSFSKSPKKRYFIHNFAWLTVLKLTVLKRRSDRTLTRRSSEKRTLDRTSLQQNNWVENSSVAESKCEKCLITALFTAETVLWSCSRKEPFQNCLLPCQNIFKV